MCDWVSTPLGFFFGKANSNRHFSTLVCNLMAQSCHGILTRERERETGWERELEKNVKQQHICNILTSRQKWLSAAQTMFAKQAHVEPPSSSLLRLRLLLRLHLRLHLHLSLWHIPCWRRTTWLRTAAPSQRLRLPTDWGHHYDVTVTAAMPVRLLGCGRCGAVRLWGNGNLSGGAAT